jgi:hypothetical protein
VSYTVWDLVEVRAVNNMDRALYAKCDIRRGQFIGCFDGRATMFPLGPDGRLETGTFEFKDLIQLRRIGGAVLALAPMDAFDGIDFVNHSCRPNAAVRQGVVLTARRAIRKGEEITMDYRKIDVVPEGIRCWCPEPQCSI